MAITIDPRPTVFGDRLIVTGTYEAGDEQIDLSNQLANIDAFIINPATSFNGEVQNLGNIDGSAGAQSLETVNLVEFGNLNGPTAIQITVPIKGVVTKGGTFLAIGRRS